MRRQNTSTSKTIQVDSAGNQAKRKAGGSHWYHLYWRLNSGERRARLMASPLSVQLSSHPIPLGTQRQAAGSHRLNVRVPQVHTLKS